jgi:hypothetical protein
VLSPLHKEKYKKVSCTFLKNETSGTKKKEFLSPLNNYQLLMENCTPEMLLVNLINWLGSYGN